MTTLAPEQPRRVRPAPPSGEYTGSSVESDTAGTGSSKRRQAEIDAIFADIVARTTTKAAANFVRSRQEPREQTDGDTETSLAAPDTSAVDLDSTGIADGADSSELSVSTGESRQRLDPARVKEIAALATQQVIASGVWDPKPEDGVPEVQPQPETTETNTPPSTRTETAEPLRVERKKTWRQSKVLRRVGALALGLVAGIWTPTMMSNPTTNYENRPEIKPEIKPTFATQSYDGVGLEAKTELGVGDNVRERKKAAKIEAAKLRAAEEARLAAERKPFKVNNGELVGVLSIPRICLGDIQIFQYPDTDVVNSGSAIIDQEIPDQTPQPQQCGRVDEERAQNPEYISRGTRVRSHGPVSQFQPRAGMIAEAGGQNLPYTRYPGEVAPGEINNTVIAGHGSTKSAPFADASLLREGDQITMTRSDGAVIVYEYIEGGPLPVNGDPVGLLHQIQNYRHDGYESILTTYNCSNEDGTTGSKDYRDVRRFGMISITYPNVV